MAHAESDSGWESWKPEVVTVCSWCQGTSEKVYRGAALAWQTACGVTGVNAACPLPCCTYGD